jgi:microsomal dipeptidase-like Zn-dependent dipeptidase
MPDIKANSGIVTQINLFTVKPENQQALIDLLIESARSVCHLPGWKSASIGLDGKTIVNYARSADMESQERVVASLRENGLVDHNKQLGEAHPGLYEAVFTLEA